MTSENKGLIFHKCDMNIILCYLYMNQKKNWRSTGIWSTQISVVPTSMCYAKYNYFVFSNSIHISENEDNISSVTRYVLYKHNWSLAPWSVIRFLDTNKFVHGHNCIYRNICNEKIIRRVYFIVYRFTHKIMPKTKSAIQFYSKRSELQETINLLCIRNDVEKSFKILFLPCSSEIIQVSDKHRVNIILNISVDDILWLWY